MDELAWDPEVGPELFQLLSKKYVENKKALQAAQEENEMLKQEVKSLLARGPELVKLEPRDLEMLEAACKLGVCKSKDDVEDIRNRLTESERESQRKDESFTRLKAKYNEAKKRSNERHHALQELQAAYDEIKLQISSAKDSPQLPNAVYPTTQICWPKGMKANKVPDHVRQLACDGSIVLCEAPLGSVDPIQGSATMYAPMTRCVLGHSEHQWIPWDRLAQFAGQTRDIFYWFKHGGCYAGTFEASQILVVGTEEYRCLPDSLRKNILQACLLQDDVNATDDDLDKVANRHWSGQVKSGFLQWRRVGFNMKLFDAFMELRGIGMNKELANKQGVKRKDQNSRPDAQRKRTKTQVS